MDPHQRRQHRLPRRQRWTTVRVPKCIVVLYTHLGLCMIIKIKNSMKRI